VRLVAELQLPIREAREVSRGDGGPPVRGRRLQVTLLEPRVADLQGKIHRVDPDFGSTLTASNRDSQSNCWVNWKIMGQPCEFQVCGGIREADSEEEFEAEASIRQT
jgi:hypothetical protein